LLSDSQLEQVRKFAEEVAVREGCLLYDIEFHDGPSRALRVFIDKSDGVGGGGVSIDDCANVSRALNLRLDIEDVVPGGHYDLEVSSPGMDRKLTQGWHFERAVGQQVRLQYRDPAGKVMPYEGKLVSVEGSQVKFANGKGDFAVELTNIVKARIHLAEVFSKKPMPGKKKKGK
jgi:ribosome maturation factor RimP